MWWLRLGLLVRHGPMQVSGMAWFLAEVTRVTRPYSFQLVAGSPRSALLAGRDSAHERERGSVGMRRAGEEGRRRKRRGRGSICFKVPEAFA